MAAALATAYKLPPEDPEESARGSMPFLAHLDELRKRILRSCIAIAAGTVIAFAFVDRIFRFVFAPAMRMLPAGSRLIYTGRGVLALRCSRRAPILGTRPSSPRR